MCKLKILAAIAIFSIASSALADLSLEELNPNALHNSSDPLDVDNNQIVSPIDALIIINHLQPRTAAQVQVSMLSSEVSYFLDTSNDQLVSPIDALLVINRLNLVPEPSSIVSCALGAMLLAGYAWRRRRLRA